MTQTLADSSSRVLIFAPIGRDAALTQDLLARADIDSTVCDSGPVVSAALGAGAAAVILTEEVFDTGDFAAISEALRAQPPWSDIPVLLFTGGHQDASAGHLPGLLAALPNVTLLDRPVRVAALISVVRAAIRARNRQLEVRRLLEAFNAAREEAERANRLKDEFLATLSHELRTPLNAIIGWIAMLRNTPVDASRLARALEVIDRNAHAQAQLVEDVLDMGRVITGKLRLEIRPVQMRPIIEAAVESLRLVADAREIDLRVAGLDDPMTIRGDADRLQQVLWNLLSNALKFTPSRGRVEVWVEQTESHVVVSVRDTGIGLDPQFLPFVFDRFRQADQTATRGHGGLGLGLAIVKHLVELHGGSVTAWSDGVGRGCTFTVHLPVPVIPLPPAIPAGVADAFAMRLEGVSILVVDDDASTRELLRELFEHARATVSVAATAPAALASFRAAPPDLLVADIGLPGEDGLSLMRRIRALPSPESQVPALALSAYTRPADGDAARHAGFSAFLGKPAAPQDVLRVVGRLLADR